MIRAIVQHLKNRRRFNDALSFLRVADQYEKDAQMHRNLAKYHDAEADACELRAKAARQTAKKL